MEGNEYVVGDMKSVGLYSSKWTPKLDSYLGDPFVSGDSWHVSSEWMRKADLKSTPLSKSSETLGDNCVQSRLDGMLL